MQPQERLRLFNHYINYCQTTILHLQTEMAGLAHDLAHQMDPRFLDNVLRAMGHIERQVQAELDWVRGLREEDLAQREALPNDYH